MTLRKPLQAKRGRKSKQLKSYQDKLLKVFFDSKDITPWQASLYVPCGYEYALRKFDEFYGNLTPSEIVSRILFVKNMEKPVKFGRYSPPPKHE